MAATDKNMTFDVNLLPATTGDHNLGSSSLKWNLFADKINGSIPTLTDTNVTQSGNAENKAYPILLKNTNSTTDETASIKYSNNITDNVSTSKPFTYNPSTGILSVPKIQISIKDDSFGFLPYQSNWNSLGASNLYWYRSYVTNYYGTTSHITNWDSDKNIGTAASSSAASVKGLVNFYNECAAGGTQTKTALQASATSNITLTLPNATGTLALTSSNITGNAATATAFSANKTVELTGDVTGSASSTGGWSIATTIGAGKVTNNMLAGSIANGKLSNSKVTIAGTDVSLGGSITADTLRTSLGLSNAMHFRGIATVAITDNSSTNPTITGYDFGTNGANAKAGDVVIDKDSAFEYVWSADGTAGKWERLGGDSSYKTTQTTVNDPAASGTSTTFIKTISQDTNGVITATKANLPTASTTVAGITTVGASGGAATYGHTHTLSIAADSGTNQLTLAASTKYKLTAGGSAYIFTTPPNNAVTHTVKTTTKYYITGTETSTTSTGGDTFDTGIYATTTAGELSAVRHSYNNGTEEKLYTCYNSTDNSLDFIFV